MINCHLLRESPSAGILLAGDFNQLELKGLWGNFNLRKLVLAPTRENSLDRILPICLAYTILQFKASSTWQIRSPMAFFFFFFNCTTYDTCYMIYTCTYFLHNTCTTLTCTTYDTCYNTITLVKWNYS